MKRSEDYTQALEKALSFMKGHEKREISVEEFSEIFPEFKMSEDEYMRRALIKFTRENQYMYTEYNGHKITKEEFIMWLEKKPVGNVAPNFKVGEWYVDKQDGTILRITKVLENTYKYITNTGREYYCSHYSLEQDTRPWSIQDAKDGDVLAYNDGSLTIFRYRLSGLNAGLYMSHVLLTDKIEFKQTCAISNVHPATKEQRDALMKAMADAGYTFDFEKKELEKIEQTPAEWEPQIGDIFIKKGTTSPTYHLCEKREDGITFGFVENREVGISGGEITIFSLKQDYELVERPRPIENIVEEELNKALQTKAVQKHSWSEEDEKMIDAIYSCVDSHYDGLAKDALLIWLKSLKDRIQPKQEWSEEDDSMVEDVRNSFEFHCDEMTEALQEQYNKFFDKVKSLRPQNTWKPSEEQIEVLEDTIKAYNEVSFPTEVRVLSSLLSELKKL